LKAAAFPRPTPGEGLRARRETHHTQRQHNQARGRQSTDSVAVLQHLQLIRVLVQQLPTHTATTPVSED
jgi:hypothetical protein